MRILRCRRAITSESPNDSSDRHLRNSPDVWAGRDAYLLVAASVRAHDRELHRLARIAREPTCRGAANLCCNAEPCAETKVSGAPAKKRLVPYQVARRGEDYLQTDRGVHASKQRPTCLEAEVGYSSTCF